MANLTYAGERDLPALAQEQYGTYAEDSTRSLSELFEVLARRWQSIVLTAFALTTIAAAVAMKWPAVYRSPATVLVQDQEVPQDLVRPTVTSLVDERIQVISQQVMTRAVLLGIVEKYNLYPDMRKAATNEQIIDRMRKDIQLTTISSDVKGRVDDRRRQGTIAFQISYDSDSPQAAQRVVNELVSLYLNENLRTRQQRAAETSSFLNDEAEKLSATISEMEAKLSDFKARNIGRLPQNSQFNVNVIDRLEQEIIRIDQNISNAEEKRQVTLNQLAQVKDMVPATPPIPAAALERGAVFEPPERLRYLQSQLASLLGNYSDDHPDVRRVKREITSIEKEIGGAHATRPSTDALELARTKLQMLRDKYSDDHPDVQRQRRELSALESQQTRSAAAVPAPASSIGLSGETRAETQLKITLQGQLKAVEGELKSLRAAKRELQVKLATLERRVEQTPVVEKHYQDLLRDYDNATLRYREIKAKQMQAAVAESLEKDSKGERFTLIDPPSLPEKPAKPNRRLILALGMVLAIGGGLGLGFLREAIDRSVHGTRQLVRLVHAPVLGAIPYVYNMEDLRRERRTQWTAIASGAVVLSIAVAYVHFFVTPLPVLWYMIERRLGIDD